MFWMDLRTPVISLHNTNWSIFITEIECVYYAVRTDFLNVIQINFVFNGFKLNKKKFCNKNSELLDVKGNLYILGRTVLQSTVQYTTLQKSGHCSDH